MVNSEPVGDAPTKLDIPVCRALPEHIEIRAEQENADSSMPVMSGHFSTFNTWYEINSMFEGEFMERIAPGAFKKTLNDDAGRKNPGERIKVLLEHGHDPTVGDKPLGVPRSLGEDGTGPAYEVPLLDTSYNRDLVPALEAGAYGSSFRFRVMRDEWVEQPERTEANPNGIPERTIKEVRVMEFGPTAFPANSAATAGLRSTTDSYYEKVRSRHPEQYAEALRSSHAGRRTSTPVAPEPVPVTPVPVDAAPEAVDEPLTHSSSDAATTSGKRSTSMDVDNGGYVMTVDERSARQEEIRSRLAEIDTEHNGAALPDETQTEWDSLSNEHDEHDTAIRAANARAKRIKALAGTPGHTERGTDFGAPEVIRRPDNIFDVMALRREARSMDDLARLTRDNALRAVEAGHYPSAKSKEDAQAHAENLLRSVDDKEATLARRVLVTGSPVYDRAFGKAVLAASDRGCTNEERAALAMGADATGAFAVPFQLDPTVILTNAGVVNPIRQIARTVQITGKTWEGITSAGISVSRAAEATEATDNSPTLAQPTATPTRVQGFVPFSFEVDQDWTQMRGELGMMFQEAKDTEESSSFILGVGTTVNPQGVVVGAATGTLLSTATTLVFVAGDLYTLHDALAPRHVPNASWLANKATYSKIRQFDTAGGANLWERIGSGRPNELLGYPAYEASAMASALTSASRIMLFGDFKKFLIVDKIGMSVELIPHLFGGTANYPTGQRGMYAVWRNTSKILDADAIRLLKVL